MQPRVLFTLGLPTRAVLVVPVGSHDLFWTSTLIRPGFGGQTVVAAADGTIAMSAASATSGVGLGVGTGVLVAVAVLVGTGVAVAVGPRPLAQVHSELLPELVAFAPGPGPLQGAVLGVQSTQTPVAGYCEKG